MAAGRQSSELLSSSPQGPAESEDGFYAMEPLHRRSELNGFFLVTVYSNRCFEEQNFSLVLFPTLETVI